MTRMFFFWGGGGVAKLLKSEKQPDYPHKNQLQFINTEFNVEVLTALKMYIMFWHISLVEW
jgi:hypothetical protein